MGITTCAIVENRLRSEQLEEIGSQLNANAPLANTMREFDAVLRRRLPRLRAALPIEPWKHDYVRNSHDPNRSDTDSDFYPHFVNCAGPFGNLRINEKLAELSWYYCRWHIFLKDPQF